MGLHYHKLPENRRPRSGFPATAWVLVRRVAVRTVGIYVGRRRWAARQARKVTWMGLWARVRRSVGLARVGMTGRHVPPARYDSVSYARNFDDGVWKEEDEEFWRSGSFAYRFGGSGRFVS